MKYERLTDGAPVGRDSPEVDDDNKDQHEYDGDGREHHRDEETHDNTAQQTQQTRVPAEVAERRPGNCKKIRCFFSFPQKTRPNLRGFRINEFRIKEALLCTFKYVQIMFL